MPCAPNPAGKKDAWNGVFGGLAAGAALGMRLGRLPVGVGAAVVLAATSAVHHPYFSMKDCLCAICESLLIFFNSSRDKVDVCSSFPYEF